MIDPNLSNFLYSLGAPAGASIVTVYIFLYFQQRAKPANGNGNGKDNEIKAREMGQITSDINHLRKSVDALTTGMNENQQRIGELAGNVQSLTAMVVRHFGK